MLFEYFEWIDWAIFFLCCFFGAFSANAFLWWLQDEGIV